MLLDYVFGPYKCWSPEIDFLKHLQRVTTVTNECHRHDTFLSKMGCQIPSVMVVTHFSVTFPQFFRLSQS